MRRKTPRTEHQVGNYRLVRLIAEGGMGQVYEVTHIELERRAALKLLRPDIARNDETAGRFFNEARAASLVEHPGLVQVYEFGHLDDGGAYIVMEYVQGELLRDRIQKCGGRLPPALAIPVARQMASALQAAHDKGVIHRDLKPENVKLVPDDEASIGERAKVLDFGLAKMLHASSDKGLLQTREGQLLGTPVYMAPEQAGGQGSIGPHTDVYALGVVLFELLSGRPPFIAEEASQLIGKHLFASPPLLREAMPDADLALDELLQRMLAKSPELRPTMQTVASELGQIDRRLRSNASGQISKLEDSLNTETVVFRKSKADRFEVIREFLKYNRQPWIRVGMATLLGGILGLGAFLVVKASFTPSAQVSLSVKGNLNKDAGKRPDAESNTNSEKSSVAPTSGSTAVVTKSTEPVRTDSLPHREAEPAARAQDRPMTRPILPNPNDPVGNLRQAEIFLEKGNNRKAIEFAKSAPERNPSRAWFIIGMAACRSKNIELSNEAYRRLDTSGQLRMNYACWRNGLGRTTTGYRLDRP